MYIGNGDGLSAPAHEIGLSYFHFKIYCDIVWLSKTEIQQQLILLVYATIRNVVPI